MDHFKISECSHWHFQNEHNLGTETLYKIENIANDKWLQNGNWNVIIGLFGDGFGCK